MYMGMRGGFKVGNCVRGGTKVMDGQELGYWYDLLGCWRWEGRSEAFQQMRVWDSDDRHPTSQTWRTRTSQDRRVLECCLSCLRAIYINVQDCPYQTKLYQPLAIKTSQIRRRSSFYVFPRSIGSSLERRVTGSPDFGYNKITYTRSLHSGTC